MKLHVKVDSAMGAGAFAIGHTYPSYLIVGRD